jgi:hypothetical protein
MKLHTAHTFKLGTKPIFERISFPTTYTPISMYPVVQNFISSAYLIMDMHPQLSTEQVHSRLAIKYKSALCAPAYYYANY